MNIQLIYQSLLALHIVGFITAFGTLVSSLVSYNQFWKLYTVNEEQGKSAFLFFLKTRKVGMFGLFFAVLAGLGMEFIVGGAHAFFLWFKIKMCLVIFIFINGFTMGRTVTMKLQKLIDCNLESQNSDVKIEKLKRNTHIFQYTQLLIYFFIIIMAAFRFR